MMVRMGFNLSPKWNTVVGKLDLRKADESTLRYDVFLGDSVFQIGECDFSTNWGWVPILDFAAGIEHALMELCHGEEQGAFDFTESTHEIRFRKKQGEQIEVRSTYSDGVAESAFDELLDAAGAFSRSVISELGRKWPELQENTGLARWYGTR